MASVEDAIPPASAQLVAPGTFSDGGLERLSVTELEQTLRDGVILARLSRRFLGHQAVPRIFVHPKLQYRHSDNINYFFRFVRHVGLPEVSNLMFRTNWASSRFVDPSLAPVLAFWRLSFSFSSLWISTTQKIYQKSFIVSMSYRQSPLFLLRLGQIQQRIHSHTHVAFL